MFWFSVIFILSAGAVLAFIGFIRDKKANAIVGLGLTAVNRVASHVFEK
jgi:molybdopterin synthase catalytic subunit